MLKEPTVIDLRPAPTPNAPNSPNMPPATDTTPSTPTRKTRWTLIVAAAFTLSLIGYTAYVYTTRTRPSKQEPDEYRVLGTRDTSHDGEIELVYDQNNNVVIPEIDYSRRPGESNEERYRRLDREAVARAYAQHQRIVDASDRESDAERNARYEREDAEARQRARQR